MNKLILFFCSFYTINASAQSSNINVARSDANGYGQIQILNFGTFHMSYTPDATTTEFDENDKKNQQDVHDIAKALAAFQPTVILVEQSPAYDSLLSVEYLEYVSDPSISFDSPSEIELLAFELGRLCETKRIYGIDHSMGYNYQIGSEIDNTLDPATHNSFYQNPSDAFPFLKVDAESLTLKEKLIGINSNGYLDFLITINADMLTHVATAGNYEGADEAAKYYQRNLRMYSNMNGIDLHLDDRVFILMGASHTAFFRDFISRSPKYTMVDTGAYLR